MVAGGRAAGLGIYLLACRHEAPRADYTGENFRWSGDDAYSREIGVVP